MSGGQPGTKEAQKEKRRNDMRRMRRHVDGIPPWGLFGVLALSLALLLFALIQPSMSMSIKEQQKHSEENINNNDLIENEKNTKLLGMDENEDEDEDEVLGEFVLRSKDPGGVIPSRLSVDPERGRAEGGGRGLMVEVVYSDEYDEFVERFAGGMDADNAVLNASCFYDYYSDKYTLVMGSQMSNATATASLVNGMYSRGWDLLTVGALSEDSDYAKAVCMGNNQPSLYSHLPQHRAAR